MKLWLLRPVENLLRSDDPWRYGGDAIYSFVVRAETAEMARNYADENAGEENLCEFVEHPWLEPKYTICVEVMSDGKPGIIDCDGSTVWRCCLVPKDEN